MCQLASITKFCFTYGSPNELFVYDHRNKAVTKLSKNVKISPKGQSLMLGRDIYVFECWPLRAFKYADVVDLTEESELSATNLATADHDRQFFGLAVF